MIHRRCERQTVRLLEKSVSMREGSVTKVTKV